MASVINAAVGDTITLGVHLTNGASGVLGQTPTAEIRRESDGWYFDFDAVSAPFWKTTGGSKEKALTERTWAPGFSSHQWDQSLYENAIQKYVVVYRNANPYPLLDIEEWVFKPGAAEIAVEVLEASLNAHYQVSGSVAEALAIIRGLCQQNFYLDETDHNAEGLLIAGRIRLFIDSSKMPATDGGTETDGLVATYTINAEEEASDGCLVKWYKVTKV
jgi:hypothetical protein